VWKPSSCPAAALEGGSGIACGKGRRGVRPKLLEARLRIQRFRAYSLFYARPRVAGGNGTCIGPDNGWEVR
jgi:hypothetical protein